MFLYNIRILPPSGTRYVRYAGYSPADLTISIRTSCGSRIVGILTDPTFEPIVEGDRGSCYAPHGASRLATLVGKVEFI